MDPVNFPISHSPQTSNLGKIPFVNRENRLCVLVKVNKADEQIIKEYRIFYEQLHLDDFINKALEKMQVSFNQSEFDHQLEEFKKRLREEMDACMNRFADGENRLIVIHCKDEIVAGSFYELEENGEILWIQSFAFDRHISNASIYSLKILDYFSDKEQFPNLQKITAMIRKTSNEKQALFLKEGFEFKENSQRLGYDKELYDAFVKTIA